MRFKTEIRKDADDEIVIICAERNEKIKRLEGIIENALGTDGEMILSLGDVEHFVPKKDVLFFETSDGKVVAHTRDRMYGASYTLLGLEAVLPECFMRVSKSTIVNVRHTCSDNVDIFIYDSFDNRLFKFFHTRILQI